MNGMIAEFPVQNDETVTPGNWKLYSCNVMTYIGPIGNSGAIAFDKVTVHPTDVRRVRDLLGV